MPRGQIWGVRGKSPGIGAQTGDGWALVSPPAGWGWALPIAVRQNGSRFGVAGGFDVSSRAIAGKAYYVSPTGNDANNGLTAETPLRALKTALAKADVDVIYVAAGSYARSYAWDGITLARSVSIIGTGGRAVISLAQDNLTWALTAGQTNTYQTTRSGAGKVLDASSVDANGDYQELVLQSSIATVEANAGSYWISGSLVYVHASDHRAPDSNIWVTLTSRNGKIVGDVHVYLENIDFVGGYAGLEFDNSGAGQTPELYAKNCTFRHAMGSGLEVTGQSLVILQGCLAAKNSADGFNYHALNGVVPKVIEIGCTGRDNGAAGDDDNGTSIHDGGSILRLNGLYYRNKGPNMADSAALESWNLGCTAHTSQASVAGARIDFNSLGGSGAMWLDRCISYGSNYGIVAAAGSTIHKRLCNSTAPDGGAGTIDTY